MARKLGRTTDIRMSMLRTLTTDLIMYGKITTTETRAKEVKKINIQELINEIIEETKLIETDKNGEIDIYSTKDNGKIYNK